MAEPTVVEEFFNPRSMITPGVAGGVMMFLVNGLAGPFPEMPPRYLALGLSFLLGGFIVLRAHRYGVAERLLYWLVTSLVVFVIGYGSNHLGKAAVALASDSTLSVARILPQAHADEGSAAPAASRVAQQEGELRQLKAQLAALEARRKELEAANAQLQQAQKAPAPPAPRAAPAPAAGEARAERRETAQAFFREW